MPVTPASQTFLLELPYCASQPCDLARLLANVNAEKIDVLLIAYCCLLSAQCFVDAVRCNALIDLPRHL